MSIREWAGRLLLRAPAPLRSLRNAPLIGGLIHRLSAKVVPSEEKIWVQVNNGPAKGIWMRLNPRTGQQYMNGEAEAATQHVLMQHLRPGMVFYDIGANIGLFSLLAARTVGAKGRVYSFEPDAEAAERLKANAQRNFFSHVSVSEVGVWSSSGTRDFAAADASSPDRGTGRLVPNGDGRPVACVSIDDFVRTALPPDAIKCDVEGAESEVLRGAIETLRMRRPWILCETHSAEADRESREILQKLDYLLESVDANHFLALPAMTEKSVLPAENSATKLTVA